MKLHIYQNRHVFAEDDHIGKYDTTARAVRLRAEHADLGDKVKAFFMRTKGLPVKVLTGDEALPTVAPLKEFPDEIRAAMDPQRGDLTPAVVDYARRNFTREEFERRYRGRAEYYQFEPPDEEETPAAPVEPAEPTAPARKPRKPKTTQPADA